MLTVGIIGVVIVLEIFNLADQTIVSDLSINEIEPGILFVVLLQIYFIVVLSKEVVFD